MKKRLATAILGLGLGFGLVSGASVASYISPGALAGEVSDTCVLLKCTVERCDIVSIYPC